MTNVAERPEAGLLRGTIRDVVFRDVTAVGENGILLSGRSARLRNISFDNVSMTVATIGNCTCAKGNLSLPRTGCRDYRPRSPDPVSYGPTSGILLEGEGDVRFDNVRVRFEGTPQPYWAGCLKRLPRDAWSVQGKLNCSKSPFEQSWRDARIAQVA